MKTRFKVTKMFFDRPAVINAVDKATRKALNHFGGFVKKTAKNSIKRAPEQYTKKGNETKGWKATGGTGVSRPGSPPFSRTGLLKKFIFSFYDPSSRSVVIGPSLLHRRSEGLAPAALEYGGTSKSTAFNRRRGGRYTRKVKIAPRPYMGPAFEIGKSRLPEMWAGSVKP